MLRKFAAAVVAANLMATCLIAGPALAQGNTSAPAVSGQAAVKAQVKDNGKVQKSELMVTKTKKHVAMHRHTRKHFAHVKHVKHVKFVKHVKHLKQVKHTAKAKIAG
jgi:hypothetical protein